MQQLRTEEEPLEVCFLENLPGKRLSDSLSLDRETLRSIVRELGEQISRMHTIRPEDIGAAAHFFENDTDDFLATEAEFVRLALQAGLTAPTLDRAFRYYEA